MSSNPTQIRATHHPGRGVRQIVLLHSLALDRTIWDVHLPRLTDLAGVHALDLPGHGASGKFTDTTIEDMADDVAAFLLGNGSGPVVVCGLSLGGSVAQALAARYPRLVAGLGLVDTTPWYGPNASEAWESRAQKVKERGFEALADFQLARWFTPSFLEGEPDLANRLLGIFSANDVDSYVATCRAMGIMDLREAVETIRVPTTVLVGEHDPATPPDHAKDLAERIPDSRLRILDGCSHLSPLEKPDDFVDEVARLLERVG